MTPEGYLTASEHHRGRARKKIEILCEQQNHRCCYCGVRFDDTDPMGPWCASIEHVIRLCDGGSRTWDNEVAACRRCNSGRGNHDAVTFYGLIKQIVDRGHHLDWMSRRAKIAWRHARRRRIRAWQAERRAADSTVLAVVRVERKSLGSLGDLWPQMVGREGIEPPASSV